MSKNRGYYCQCRDVVVILQQSERLAQAVITALLPPGAGIHRPRRFRLFLPFHSRWAYYLCLPSICLGVHIGEFVLGHREILFRKNRVVVSFGVPLIHPQLSTRRLYINIDLCDVTIKCGVNTRRGIHLIWIKRITDGFSVFAHQVWVKVVMLGDQDTFGHPLFCL